MTLALCAVQLVNGASGYALNAWGVLPRSLPGLVGIPLAPWLHGSWAHLLGNLAPLLAMASLVLSEGGRRFVGVSALVIGVGGLLVWLFGRHGLHVGASGWVFGLWVYIVARAWYRRSLANACAALAVLLLYGGLVYGFLPKPGLSVESHLGGAMGGLIAARLLQGRRYGAAAAR